jgi:hypothetical protein
MQCAQGEGQSRASANMDVECRQISTSLEARARGRKYLEHPIVLLAVHIAAHARRPRVAAEHLFVVPQLIRCFFVQGVCGVGLEEEELRRQRETIANGQTHV